MAGMSLCVTLAGTVEEQLVRILIASIWGELRSGLVDGEGSSSVMTKSFVSP